MEPEVTVSIRSPHKSKGRHSMISWRWFRRMFQSAPLTKARGDIAPSSWWLAQPSFNPLPSQKQGETGGFSPGGFSPGVSIRSPHKSKGRRLILDIGIGILRFQSAPLTKARGDVLLALLSRGDYCFNPLPSQKQGETFSSRLRRGRRRSFNPLPSQKQGETALRSSR